MFPALRALAPLLFSVIILFASASAARAESVQWNTASFTGYTPGNYIDACDTPLLQRLQFGYPCISILNSPNVTVTYHVDATNETTGENVCNTTVPAGTKIKFDFVPHVYSDVSWFGTGYDFDSPYGDWSANADHPPTSDTAQWCADKNFFHMGGARKQYILLQVAPPVKTVANTQGLTCGTPSANGSVECTTTSGGSITPQFQFQSTIGKFYYALDFNPSGSSDRVKSYLAQYQPSLSIPDNCMTAPNPLYIHTSDIYTNVSGRKPLIVDVPTETIDCPITITGGSTTTTPKTPGVPVVTTPSAICKVGTAFTLSFSSTDPGGHQVRYGVDWDNDGSVDQWVPSSGYVNSGTSQSASRTYTTAGHKQVEIVTENDQGVRSEWAPYSFNCNNGENVCPIGYVLQGGTCVFNKCPVGYVLQGSACIFSACPAGYILQGTQCVQSNQCTAPNYCQGNNVMDGCTGQVLQQCQWGCRGGRCNGVPGPVATLTAIPSLVNKGNTTQVSWTAGNVTSCSVTSTNDDSWSTLTGTQTSKPIQSQTTFTLRCEGYQGATPGSISKSVIVNVAPRWMEQ